MAWDTVIGLEIHVQLATQTKIFSGAPASFGAAPNTQACAVDLAMPGTLPVLNEAAVRGAVLFGLAVHAPINRHSVFERKNYFYPDLPKGYQTSQLEQPIVGPGYIEIMLDDGSTKKIRLHHAHLEEDAGKSLHEDFHGMSGIDLNRAGTPLLEVVTEPDMSNPAEAVAFAKKLHSIVTAIGICDGEMSQGSLRFDVNISVKPSGSETLGTRTETKNLNSFKFMEEAINLEVRRQIEVLEDGGSITQETRLYDGDTRQARAMRSKEEANDYRYFPCPDLLPVAIEDSYIEALREQLPELPEQRQHRLMADYKLEAYDASILSDNAAACTIFEAAAMISGDSKLAANWVIGELTAKLNSNNLSMQQSPVDGSQLGELIVRIKDGTISNKIAKDVFDAIWQGEGSTDEIIAKRGLTQVSDTAELEQLVAQVLAEKPKEVANYLAAEPDKRKKMLGAFVGPVMKATQGKANPGMVNKILAQKLNELG